MQREKPKFALRGKMAGTTSGRRTNNHPMRKEQQPKVKLGEKGNSVVGLDGNRFGSKESRLNVT